MTNTNTKEIKKALKWFKEEMKEGKCSNTCPQCAAYEVAINVLEKVVEDYELCRLLA